MIVTVLFLIFAAGWTGCAQTMAICRPGPVDRDVLAAGVDRSEVVDVLGPGRGRLREGAVTRTEHYTYADGGMKNSAAAKAGRVLLYTFGDVTTLFLSQILFRPAETLLAATQYRTRVNYQLYTDGSWRVKDFTETPRGRPSRGGICALGNP